MIKRGGKGQVLIDTPPDPMPFSNLMSFLAFYGLFNDAKSSLRGKIEVPRTCLFRHGTG